jgi:hypothetical protein
MPLACVHIVGRLVRCWECKVTFRTMVGADGTYRHPTCRRSFTLERFPISGMLASARATFEYPLETERCSRSRYWRREHAGADRRKPRKTGLLRQGAPLVDFRPIGRPARSTGRADDLRA